MSVPGSKPYTNTKNHEIYLEILHNHIHIQRVYTMQLVYNVQCTCVSFRQAQTHFLWQLISIRTVQFEAGAISTTQCVCLRVKVQSSS